MSSTLPLATVAVAVGTNEARKLTSGKGFDVQPVLAGFVLGIFLYGMMEVNEKVATRFCVLIIITALLINGVPTLVAIGKLFNNPSPKLHSKTGAESSTQGGSTGLGASGDGAGGGGGRGR